MRTLLLDGDIDAYQIASSCEKSIDWGDGVVTVDSNLDDAKAQLDERIRCLRKMLGATRVIVCLTDSQNFRKEILPSYKANRKGVLKPVMLGDIRRYMAEKYEVFQRPFLEADDVMGILSTMGDTDLIKGERIIVSIDKDMKSVPGLLFNPSKVDQGVIEISLESADMCHYMQTLTGDSTDNYKGCPGCGPKKAEKALTKKSPDDSYWDLIVAEFQKKGLTEADALVQAQVARICRSEDYNFLDKRPIPWTPKKRLAA